MAYCSVMDGMSAFFKDSTLYNIYKKARPMHSEQSLGKHFSNESTFAFNRARCYYVV